MPSFIILISKLVDKEKSKKIVDAIIFMLTIVYAGLMQYFMFQNG